MLELLSRSARPLRLTQIGKELGMAKSNVHWLMQALVETSLVLRDEETGAPSIKLDRKLLGLRISLEGVAFIQYWHGFDENFALEPRHIFLVQSVPQHHR